VCAVSATRLAMLAARTALAPGAGGARLLRLSDAGAVVLLRWVRRLVSVAVYGWLLCEVMRILGLPAAPYALLVDLVGVSVLGVAAAMVLRNRAPVRDRLRGAGGGRLRSRLADVWHVVALAYLAVVFLVWAVSVENGFGYLAAASAWTVAAAAVAALGPLAMAVLGAALVRDGEYLYRAHYYTADYLQDRAYHKQEVSPADVSVELTRHFRALRLWLPLKLIGVAPFRAMLSEKLLLARYAYRRLQSAPGFEVGPEPELSIFVFRYVDVPGDVDEFNRKLVERLRRDGTIFLTSTLIDGVYMIRFAILSYRTHIDTIDLAVDVLRREADGLKQEGDYSHGS